MKCPENATPTQETQCLVPHPPTWVVSGGGALEGEVGLDEVMRVIRRSQRASWLAFCHVGPQREGGRLQTAKRALVRTGPCWHPDLGLLASRPVSNTFLLFLSHPVRGNVLQESEFRPPPATYGLCRSHPDGGDRCQSRTPWATSPSRVLWFGKGSDPAAGPSCVEGGRPSSSGPDAAPQAPFLPQSTGSTLPGTGRTSHLRRTLYQMASLPESGPPQL